MHSRQNKVRRPTGHAAGRRPPTVTSSKWARLDSNQRRHKPTDLQSVPFGHSGTLPNTKRPHFSAPNHHPAPSGHQLDIRRGGESIDQLPARLHRAHFPKATSRNRTDDRRFTKAVLYQLSYGGNAVMIGTREPISRLSPRIPLATSSANEKAPSKSPGALFIHSQPTLNRGFTEPSQPSRTSRSGSQEQGPEPEPESPCRSHPRPRAATALRPARWG